MSPKHFAPLLRKILTGCGSPTREPISDADVTRQILSFLETCDETINPPQGTMSFFRLGLLSIAVLAFCSCGSSDQSDVIVSAGSALEVVNRFSLPGPEDEVVSQVSTSPQGHLAYTALKKDFEGDTLNYEGAVFLHRMGEPNRVIRTQVMTRTAKDQITEFHDPHLDTTGRFVSWLERRKGESSIGFIDESGETFRWSPPAGSRLIKNLGIESGPGHRLYALVEEGGIHHLVRFDPAIGEAATFLFPTISPGTLELELDGTCRYGSGMASDGQNTQLIYLVLGEKPSAQVLLSERVRATTVNNVGDVAYITQSGDLFYLRPQATATNNQSTVDAQITDSITQVNTKILGDAPAIAMGNLFQVSSQALATAAQAASLSLNDIATTTDGVATVYALDTAATSAALLTVANDNAQPGNLTSLLPPSSTLEGLDIEGTRGAVVTSQSADGGPSVQVARATLSNP